MANILTIDETRIAMEVEPNFPSEQVTFYQSLADSYVKEKTGFVLPEPLPADYVINPLIKQLAILEIKQQFNVSSNSYNAEYDYSHGISSLIKDIQFIVGDEA